MQERIIKIYRTTIGSQYYHYNCNKLAEDLNDLGVTAIMTPAYDETGPHYPSSFLKKSETPPYLPQLVKALKQYNIQTILTVPIFHDPQYFDAHPDRAPIDQLGNRFKPTDWYKPVCPSDREFRELRLRQLRELLRIMKPDGLSLDFIRFPLFWETLDYSQPGTAIPEFCFCSRCLKAFQTTTHVALSDHESSAKAATQILQTFPTKWHEWKGRVIKSFVKKTFSLARQLSLETSPILHFIPLDGPAFPFDVQQRLGQRLAALSPEVDTIHPLLYHQVLQQSPGWVHQYIQYLAQTTHKHILPAIQAGRIYKSAELPLSEFLEVAHLALLPPSRGVAIFSYDLLCPSPHANPRESEGFQRLKALFSHSGRG